MTANQFSSIKSLWKRCNHFIGPVADLRPSWAEFEGWVDRKGESFVNGNKDAIYLSPDMPLPSSATPLSVMVSNYSMMQYLDDSLVERACWLDALAGALNRYIDKNKVADDLDVKKVLSWWRNQLWFRPSAL